MKLAQKTSTNSQGTFVGALMGFVSLFVVLMRFVQNLQMDSLDGAKWGSFGGLVMPSFFFQGAQDIFSNVRKGAAEAQEKFQESGRFEDIYQHIQQSQREQAGRHPGRMPWDGVRQGGPEHLE